MKKCPACAELILDEAIKCKHCKSMVDEKVVTVGDFQKRATEIMNEKTTLHDIDRIKPIRKSSYQPKGSSGFAFVGNLLWFLFGGGIILSLLWIVLGLILLLTVIGYPHAVAAFRVAGFAAFPFGKELVDKRLVGGDRITGTGFANFLWVILAGLWLAITHVLSGLACFLTIIGIPFGLAHFKLASVSFAPLGKEVVSKELSYAAKARKAQEDINDRFANK